MLNPVQHSGESFKELLWLLHYFALLTSERITVAFALLRFADVSKILAFLKSACNNQEIIFNFKT